MIVVGGKIRIFRGRSIAPVNRSTRAFARARAIARVKRKGQDIIT